jgi:WD40 repeat protein
MTKISSYGSAEEWYGDLMFMLLQGLSLDQKVNFELWLQECSYLSPLQKFNQFIETIILSQLQEKIIIFLDEIDSIIKIKFKDEFFAIIRSFYNQRSENQEYERLTFCLLGVATPSDLIQDKTRTPFNIGQAIELKGFEFEEAKKSLINGIAKVVDDPEKVLKSVLDWTGGQPFLTQKLCKLVFDKILEVPNHNVDELVQSTMIENWEANDNPEHLRTIRDRILKDEQSSSRLLGIYKQLFNQTLKADDSYAQIKLRLSGLVVKKNGNLEVYNPIYKAVFNVNWIEQELANQRKFYQENLVAWEKSGRTDNRQLLSGEILEKALKEVGEKSLSDEDQYFLNASRDYERQELKQAKEKADKIIESASKKYKQIIELVPKGTQIEQKGVQALRVFNTTPDQLQALRDVIQAGEELQQLQHQWLEIVQDNLEILNQFHLGSIPSTLRQILSKIRQWNQQDEDDLVTSLLKVKSTSIERFNVLETGVMIPNSKSIVTASWNTVQLWNLQKQELVTFKTGVLPHNSVTNLAFSPDSKILVTTFGSGMKEQWNLQRQELVTFTINGLLYCMAFSSDAKTLVTISGETAKLWNLQGQELVTFTTGHSDIVRSVAFSPNGKYLATGSDDKTAKLWNLQGQELHTFTGYSDWIMSVSFSPNGEFLVIGCGDGTATLWDLHRRELLKKFEDDYGEVMSVCFSPNSQFLVTGYGWETARLWDLQGKKLAKFPGHSDIVTSVCFSPDGQFLATTSEDKTAKLWDLQGQELAQFTGHSNLIYSLAFSPDGQYLTTGSHDGTVKVWDLQGNLLADFRGYKGNLLEGEPDFIELDSSVLGVCFTPDGKNIVAGYSDGTVRFWPFESLEELIARGKAWLGVD